MDWLAVLIEASTIKGYTVLPGARLDVQRFREFLLSPIGGAWKEEEIRTLSCPSRAMVANAIKLASLHDYAMVAFSGHGDHVKVGVIDDTRVRINDTELMLSTELQPTNDKSFLLIDSCREIAQRLSEELLARYAKSKLLQRASRIKCRALFDAAVTLAAAGPVKMFSCSVTETADDEPSYTQTFIGTAELWADSAKPSTILNLFDNYEIAKVAQRKRYPQNAEFKANRRNSHYPFAVFA